MDVIIMPLCFLIILQCFFLPLVQSQPRLAPAMYIFGDSVVDSGANNDRPTRARANYRPYGIDFPMGVTGRFTNGYTITDYLDLSLGVPLQIPYLDALSVGGKFLDGFNYASASAGILPETGRAAGTNLSMRKQVKLFRKTVRYYLPKYFSNRGLLFRHLSNSIFLVFIGSNDYANNYLQPQEYNSSRLYSPVQFGELLANELGRHLQDMYSLGARKFVVFDIGPIGCLPGTLNMVKPKTRCEEGLNGMVSIFNKKLAMKLNELNSKLRGSTFVLGQTFDLTYGLIRRPLQYGFKDTRNPCCVVGGNGTGPCIPDVVPCKDRKGHMFWDAAHPSDEAYRIVASKCFNGTDVCKPINILQLVNKPSHI